MKLTIIVLTILLSSACLAQNEIIKKIDDYMAGQKEINDFSGAVLISKNDSIIFKKAYGKADLEWDVPNTIITKFCLASITKHFTAIAIMKLVEQGKISLTDKLSEFIPDFPNGELVTIHMLLTHTSGLASDFEDLYMDSATMPKDSAVAALKKRAYLFVPGTNCKYSNIGYFLLSEIIEKASGQTYQAYVQNNILDIAGMQNTGFVSNDVIVPQIAKVYYRMDDSYFKSPYINWNLNIGHDGMYSTVEDLYKLDRVLYGNTLLLEESKLKMHTQYNKKYPDNGFLDSYGYGIMVNPYYNHGHYLLTHSGGFMGVMTTYDRYPGDNIFITVLSNNDSESHIISYGLSAILFGIPVEIPYKHIAKTIRPELLKKYEGVYGKYKILKVNDSLFLDKETRLIAESDSKFFKADNSDRTFEFIVGKNGSVKSIIVKKGGVSEVFKRIQ